MDISEQLMEMGFHPIDVGSSKPNNYLLLDNTTWELGNLNKGNIRGLAAVISSARKQGHKPVVYLNKEMN